MRRTFLIRLGAGAAILAVLAGCGSSDETLSKSEFLAEGDEICKRAHEQFAEVQEHPPGSAEAAATMTEKLIEISESELTQIRDLSAPREVQPALDRYLRARERGIAVLKRGLEAARDENAGAYASAQAQVADSQVRRIKLAQAVGFEECSRVSASSGDAGG